MQLGRPTFFLNGEPYAKPLFATYAPLPKYYSEMAGAGLELFNFQTNCGEDPYGHSLATWPEPDKWDFSQIDERAQAAVQASPNAMLFPRIYIEAPKWWRDAHPEALETLDFGGQTYQEGFAPGVLAADRTYGCIMSPEWREAMASALEKTVGHMMSSEWGSRIFGFEIAGLATEEWYHWSCNQVQLSGYSPAMEKAFQHWLSNKYGTDDALRAAWNDPSASLASARIPSKEARLGNRTKPFRDPAIEMPAIDFYLFYSWTVADTIDYFAGVIKKATNRGKVVGAFYNYFYEFNANPEFGHNAGGTLLRSSNIDFICAPPSYYERQLGSGVECYRRPFLSATLHQKLWFHDNDLASFLFPKIMKQFPSVTEEDIRHHMEVLAVTKTAQESLWQFQRAAGFTVCEGIYESYFDLHGGYYDTPRLLKGLGDIAAMLERAKTHDRSSRAQILVVADETSAAYGRFQIETQGDAYPNGLNKALMAHQPGLIRCGAPFDSVYLDDLPLVNWPQYRVVVFLNTYHMTDEARSFIDGQVKKEGRTLVWCYAPGLFNGNRREPDAMSRLAGLNLQFQDGGQLVAPVSVLTDEGKSWMAKWGEPNMPETPFGQDEPVANLIGVNDPSAMALGMHKESPETTLAMREFPEWRSVYTISSVMPPAFWRAIARQANAHVFLDTGDALYANKSYIAINAADAGEKRIALPEPSNVYDALDDAPLYQNATSFEVSLMRGETALYRYEPAHAPE